MPITMSSRIVWFPTSIMMRKSSPAFWTGLFERRPLIRRTSLPYRPCAGGYIGLTRTGKGWKVIFGKPHSKFSIKERRSCIPRFHCSNRTNRLEQILRTIYNSGGFLVPIRWCYLCTYFDSYAIRSFCIVVSEGGQSHEYESSIETTMAGSGGAAALPDDFTTHSSVHPDC